MQRDKGAAMHMLHVPPHQGNHPNDMCHGIWKHVPMHVSRPFHSQILVHQSAVRKAIHARSAFGYAIPNQANGKPDCFPYIQSNIGNHFLPDLVMYRQYIVGFSSQQFF